MKKVRDYGIREVSTAQYQNVCNSTTNCYGLRPQEPPAIRTGDVDLETGDVYIRQSKRHKDRHIIMSGDMLDLCRRYDSVAGKRQWFFQKWDAHSTRHRGTIRYGGT